MTRKSKNKIKHLHESVFQSYFKAVIKLSKKSNYNKQHKLANMNGRKVKKSNYAPSFNEVQL